MEPFLILAFIVLFIVGLIKAFWMYDEFVYKKATEDDRPTDEPKK